MICTKINKKSKTLFIILFFWVALIQSILGQRPIIGEQPLNPTHKEIEDKIKFVSQNYSLENSEESERLAAEIEPLIYTINGQMEHNGVVEIMRKEGSITDKMAIPEFISKLGFGEYLNIASVEIKPEKTLIQIKLESSYKGSLALNNELKDILWKEDLNQKMGLFTKYLTSISDSSYQSTYKNELADKIKNLFIDNNSTISISFADQKKKGQRFTVNSDLNYQMITREINYRKIKIEGVYVVYIDSNSLIKYQDGRYYGIGNLVYKPFEKPKNDHRYLDITRQTIEISLDENQINSYSENLSGLKVKYPIVMFKDIILSIYR